MRQVQGNALYTSCRNCWTLGGAADLGRDTEPLELIMFYCLGVNGLYTRKKNPRFYPPKRTRGWATVITQHALPDFTPEEKADECMEHGIV